MNAETDATNVVELHPPSKLSKVRSAALATAFYGMPIAATAAAIYFGAKMQRMQLETAKLNPKL